MKGKKIVSYFMAAALMTGACGVMPAAEVHAEGDYEKVVYAFPSFNNIPSEENIASVEEAINEITREKINVEVDLMPLNIAEYTQQVTLALQGGEAVDCFMSLGDFNNCVSTGMAADITDIVDTCASETRELIGEDWMKTTTKGGAVYGFPAYKPVALTPMVIYKQKYVDELGIDMSEVNTIEDLTDVLRKVKEAYPDITPLVPVNSGETGILQAAGDVDYLSDDYTSPKGVLMGESTEVVDFYSTDRFKELCSLTRTWYNEGLIMKDAATTTAAAAELMSADNSFCYVAAYSYPEADTAASLKAQCGNYDLGAKIIGEAYLDTSSVNALTWMIASTSKVPEAALKFLNLTFTDKDVVNLIIYGIEGRDYVKDADDFVSYPEGQDASTVPYTAQLSCGVLGNFFIMYPMAGTSKESLDWELEQNKAAKTSNAMGFSFDSSSVKTEYTAVANVVSQYLPGLQCGSVDPETELPKFIDALNSAGMESIVSAKQEQLDAWMAENK